MSDDTDTANAGCVPRESMTAAAFERAVRRTLALLERERERPIEPMRVEDKPWVSEHLAWMLGTALGQYVDGRVQKANRWLGYVQGCMACHGYALEDLKRANMPEGEAFNPEKL